MSLEGTIGSQDAVPSCVVCGTNVMETFEQDPVPHMARLALLLPNSENPYTPHALYF